MQSMTRLDQLIVEVEIPEHENEWKILQRQHRWQWFEFQKVRRINVLSQLSRHFNKFRITIKKQH